MIKCAECKFYKRDFEYDGLGDCTNEEVRGEMARIIIKHCDEFYISEDFGVFLQSAKDNMNKNKIILDLCGGTGGWSRPYKEAGYDVRVLTLPGHDVLTYKPTEDIYGILAAPPCTHFSVSGAQYWKQKDADGRTFEDIRILTACLMIIAKTKPMFWAIENPVGRMQKLLGDPRLIFNPCDYGDAYTKKTLLWGVFNIPEKCPVEPEYVTASNGDRYSPVMMKTGGKTEKAKRLRSITPLGFAKAFFNANR